MIGAKENIAVFLSCRNSSFKNSTGSQWLKTLFFLLGESHATYRDYHNWQKNFTIKRKFIPFIYQKDILI
jgi:hypothetical protein